MWQLNLLLVIQVLLGLVVVILLHRLSKMQAQVDEITKEVTEYISFIIEDEGKTEIDTSREITPEMEPKDSLEDTQSSLIQSVLGEFFP